MKKMKEEEEKYNNLSMARAVSQIAFKLVNLVHEEKQMKNENEKSF